MKKSINAIKAAADKAQALIHRLLSAAASNGILTDDNANERFTATKDQ